MYQIVTIRLLDFYLVEDMGSRDAENEGLSLNLRFKWLPQGIFWLVDGVKTPPQSCAFTSDCLCFSVSVSAMLVSMRQKNIAQVSILERYFFVSTYQAAGPDTCLAVFVVASLPPCL